MEFKDRLKALRATLKISGAKLAEALSKAPSTVGMWESGKAYPDALGLLELAKYFDVSVDYLLGITAVKRVGVQTITESTDDTLRFSELTGLSVDSIIILSNKAAHPEERDFLNMLNILVQQEAPPNPDVFPSTYLDYLDEIGWSSAHKQVLSCIQKYLFYEPNDAFERSLSESFRHLNINTSNNAAAESILAYAVTENLRALRADMESQLETLREPTRPEEYNNGDD